MATEIVTRRRALVLAGAASTIGALGACGRAEQHGDEARGSSVTAPAQSAQTTPGDNPAHRGDAALTSTAEIPVHGAKVFADHALVVTQPKAGQFRAFSSTCTHMGCTVGAGKTLVCPCHGSSYSITDGSVLGGPAPSPLPRRTIEVRDGEIYLPS